MTRASDEQTARQLYRLVISRIRNDESSFVTGEVTSAEDSLASGKGSRAATLLALARAAGLHADLALARLASESENAYTTPLVLFRLGERTIAADTSSDSAPFGAIAPSVDASSALLIPLSPGADLSKVTSVKTPAVLDQERSLAQGDITFDELGSFTANVTITMGAFRGTEMRNILRGIAPAERGHFFEQLALRLFPGAIDSTGEVRNESDPDQSLILIVNCRSPRFLNFSGQSVDMDQLVPALGLRRMYASAAARNFPLYVDSLLFEVADFRVHLPAGVVIARNATDFIAKNKFGQYAVVFRVIGPSEVEITRDFHIPIQVVAASQYPAFASFANEIDNAERQRLTLRVSGHKETQSSEGHLPGDVTLPIGKEATRTRISSSISGN